MGMVRMFKRIKMKDPSYRMVDLIILKYIYIQRMNVEIIFNIRDKRQIIVYNNCERLISFYNTLFNIFT